MRHITFPIFLSSGSKEKGTRQISNKQDTTHAERPIRTAKQHEEHSKTDGSTAGKSHTSSG